MKIEVKNPIPFPTNVQKWAAQNKGFDADYIPGFDDGEHFIRREIAEDQVMERVDEVEIAAQLPIGIY